MLHYKHHAVIANIVIAGFARLDVQKPPQRMRSPYCRAKKSQNATMTSRLRRTEVSVTGLYYFFAILRPLQNWALNMADKGNVLLMRNIRILKVYLNDKLVTLAPRRKLITVITMSLVSLDHDTWDMISCVDGSYSYRPTLCTTVTRPRTVPSILPSHQPPRHIHESQSSAITSSASTKQTKYIY